jgi:hypothetical protein
MIINPDRTGQFAAAFLNVAGAASSDPSRPLLRGVNLERTDHGLVLAATDSYQMRWSFIPYTTDDDPMLNDTVRETQFIPTTAPVIAGMRKLYSDMTGKPQTRFDREAQRRKTNEPSGLTITVAEVAGSDRIIIASDGLNERHLIVADPVPGDFPNWRGVVTRDASTAEAVQRIAFSPEFMSSLRTVRSFPKVRHGGQITFDFGGQTKPARFEIAVKPALHGLLMPVRLPS